MATAWDVEADADLLVLSDEMISEFMRSAQDELFVGVRFGSRGRVYTYISPRSAHVGSLVVTPPNSYCPEPQVATVVTLKPRVYPGPIRRLLEVLS